MIRTTLSQMYHAANPNRDRDTDLREMRAHSKTSELRVKQQAAYFGFTPSRAAHQAHALFQAKEALGNSLRERLPQASPAHVSGYRDRIWRDVIRGGTELHVYQVRELRDAVNAIPVTAGPAAPDPSVLWHPQPTVASPAPVERKAAPTPAKAGPAESTSVEDTRIRLRRENDRIEALSQLKKAFPANTLAHLNRAEQANFHERLRALVECADKVVPELMQGRAEDKACLEEAARHILAADNLILDSRSALYKALVVRDAGLAQRLIGPTFPAGASLALKSLPAALRGQG
jgi:hypothetical protein